ncbi:uncharacterized protein LOC132753419 [Ruditapes philippinarum]|uniref:uncharacterized protein LOC132753419 n=1 Tax=Ruditapes philippinarum TaxID=129788 RepID=UPI00295AA377|nr:uncharacterized protein LOC132753419 [Ruditapes philippinarum]
MLPTMRMFSLFLMLPTLSTGLFLQPTKCDVDVGPQGSREPAVRDFDVPQECSNGTFRWAYPQKTVHLRFLNQYKRQISVCIRNDMLGEIFTIRDITHSIGMPMIIGDKESCTMKYREDITLRIDAPEILYYVGSILYQVYEE